jgi:glycerophosphoryl diester phosphodiesterase
MVDFPDTWWRTDRPLVLGHRGASAHVPENTMAAFQAALEFGADGVELDVHLTADGVPVVIHNASVDATTDGHGFVNDMTLAEVQSLDAGCRFPGDARYAGQHVPTLEEVLQSFAGRLLINIELKPQIRPMADLVGTVAALVTRLRLVERVWVSSFRPYYLHRMRRLAPSTPCGLLFSPLNVGTLWLAPLTPFEAVHPQASIALQDWFVRSMRRIGKRVVVWTVDDVVRARRLAGRPGYGVDAIITNDPRAILAAVQRPVDGSP